MWWVHDSTTSALIDITRASPWGRPSSCVRPSLVTRYQVTKEFSSQLVMSEFKGLNNVESNGRTTRSSSNFHQFFKTIYIRVNWSQKYLSDHLLNNTVSVETRIKSHSAINNYHISTTVEYILKSLWIEKIISSIVFNLFQGIY